MTGKELRIETPVFRVSAPTDVNMHIVYDAELELLSTGARDRSLEWALACGGAAIGLFQNLWEAVSDVLAAQAIARGDALLALVCVGLATAGLILFLKSRDAHSQIERLVREIRERPTQEESEQALEGPRGPTGPSPVSPGSVRSKLLERLDEIARQSEASRKS